MKLKNVDIINIADALERIGNAQGNIEVKWKVALYADKYIKMRELIKNEVNNIINEQGKDDGNGNKSINTDNEDFVKLMNIQTNIDEEKIELSFFTGCDLPSTSDLIMLKPIIDNK